MEKEKSTLEKKKRQQPDLRNVTEKNEKKKKLKLH